MDDPFDPWESRSRGGMQRLSHPWWLGVVLPLVLSVASTFSPDLVRGVLLLAAVISASYAFHKTEAAQGRWTRTIPLSIAMLLLAVCVFALGRVMDTKHVPQPSFQVALSIDCHPQPLPLVIGPSATIHVMQLVPDIPAGLLMNVGATQDQASLYPNRGHVENYPTQTNSKRFGYSIQCDITNNSQFLLEQVSAVFAVRYYKQVELVKRDVLRLSQAGTALNPSGIATTTPEATKSRIVSIKPMGAGKTLTFYAVSPCAQNVVTVGIPSTADLIVFGEKSSRRISLIRNESNLFENNMFLVASLLKWKGVECA